MLNTLFSIVSAQFLFLMKSFNFLTKENFGDGNDFPIIIYVFECDCLLFSIRIEILYDFGLI